MISADCQLEIPEIEGLESGKLTVGRHLNLICKSEVSTNFDFNKLQIKGEKNISTHVFSATPNESGSFKLDLTLYTPGSHNLSEYVLTDGVNEMALNAPAVKVETVIQASADGKPTQPYGPIFPIPINIPASYYIAFAGAFILSILYSIFKARRLSYYRKLRLKLNQYASPTEPETQFYKSVRLLEKKHYPIAELEQAFRLYNLRAYKLPMFDLQNDQVIRYFKRNYPHCKSVRLHLQKLLSEFEEISKKHEQLMNEDRIEFVKKLYRYVEQNKGLI